MHPKTGNYSNHAFGSCGNFGLNCVRTISLVEIWTQKNAQIFQTQKNTGVENFFTQKQWKSLQGSQSKTLDFFEFPSLYWRPPADQKARGLWVRDWFASNLVPRVLWLFGQRVGASRDSGVLEFSYRKISAVKQWKSLQGSQSKNLDIFEFPRVSTGAHPLTKKTEDSGTRLESSNLVPRVLWLFGQRMGASRDSGIMEKDNFFDWSSG